MVIKAAGGGVNSARAAVAVRRIGCAVVSSGRQLKKDDENLNTSERRGSRTRGSIESG